MKVFIKNNRVFAFHDDNQQVSYPDCTEVKMSALPPSVPVIQDSEIIGYKFIPVILKNIPVYDQSIQSLTESWIVENGQYKQTWTVKDKTESDIITEKEAEANEADKAINIEEVKKLLRMRADSLTDAELYQFPSIYPAWRPGEALKNATDSATGKADIRQYKGKLYKVVLSHTTQIDWLPDISSSLFTVFNPPETISVFVQPTGAHDVYMKGDKVHFPTINDSIYESLIDNNSYSPTEYPQGWKKL